MKRWLRAVAALLAVVCLSGCANSHPDNVAQPVMEGFSCQAAIHYRELEVITQLTRQTDGKVVMTFSLPKSLSGITLGWDGVDMTMELGGMSMALPVDKVPESALIRCVLDVLAAEHPDGSETEEGYTITGEVDGKAYVLVCDSATGLPLSLSMPEEELEATFTAGKRLSEETE